MEACKDYTLADRGGGAVELANYVKRFPAATQPTLLRNLLHADVGRRRENGETPLSAEYVELLPEHANLVRSVFLETVSAVFVSPQLSTHYEATNIPRSLETLPSGDRIGSFRLLRQLGRGGMGLVFEAEHLHRKHRVALKTLPAVDGNTLLAFKQEFRRMAELNHPNIVGLHALEEDHGHWYFTMDLIDGTDFCTFVRPTDVLNEKRLRSTLPQLVSAVLKLHSDNLIHRDLKPSNVMVDRDGKLIVLDFGLAYERKVVNGASVDGIKGTVAYMAPEQTVDGSVTGAADWYAVGVMLYEAISGKRPYKDLPPIELILQKRLGDFEELKSEEPELSDLVGLANSLLKNDPAQRPEPPAIARVVCKSVEPQAAKSVGEVQIGLVGREKQQAMLEEVYRRCQRESTPETAFISGRSGEGKTALADSFLEKSLGEPSHYVLLAGRCYDRESVPFKALDSLVDALANHLCRQPEAEAALLMPDEITFLAHLFPVLNRVPAVAKLAVELDRRLDQIQVRTRAFAGLRSLLKRISRTKQIVLFADDLQWGDADSAQALFDILRPPEAPNVFFIGSYRCEETDRSAFLVRWQQLTSNELIIRNTEVTVSALSIEQCVQLSVNTVGEDSERLRALALELASQTGGNALLLTELLSCFDASSDSFKAIPLVDVIRTKLERLPAEASSMLETIAVSGSSIEFDELALAAQAKQEASSVVTHMRSEKLVRLIGDENSSRVDTFHDKIRETVLLSMSAERRQAKHHSLANAILQSIDQSSVVPDRTGIDDKHISEENGQAGALPQAERALAERVFDLSYHFDGAGDSENAFHFSLLAAQQATSQFSQRVAADHFVVARRNAPNDPKLKFEIAEGEGRALTLLGEYEQAQEILAGAVTLTEDDIEQAQVLGMQAEVFHKQGKIAAGIDHYARALRKLGYFVPRSRGTLVAALAYETLVQFLHTYLPKSFYRRPGSLSPKQRLAIELANRKSIVSYYSNAPRMIWTHIKGMNIAETREPSKEMAYSYGLHPAPLAAVGLAKRGLRYSDGALEYAVKSGDLLTEGHCYTMRSMAYFTIGQHPQSISSAKHALECLDRAGDPYLAFIASGHLSFSSARECELKESIVVAEKAFERAIQLGERASLAALLFALALGTRGDFPYQELRSCYEIEEGDNYSYCFSKIAEGLWHFYAGRFSEAIEVLEQSWSRVISEMTLVPYFVEGMAYLVTAYRTHALSLAPDDKDQRKRLLSRSRRLLWQLAVLSRVFPYLRPHCLREVGLFYHLNGKPKKAQSRLQASIELAEKGGDVLEQTESALALGNVELELGIPTAEARIIAAHKKIDEMRAEVVEQVAISFGRGKT